MLLISRLRFRFRRRGERGGALVAVVGLAAVMMAFILLSSSMIVTSFRYSDTTRGGVQAQAAAQAGIAVAAAQLTQGTCALPYTSSVTPKYSVSISYQRTVSGTTWLTGCPSNATDVNKVKIVSVGTSQSSTAATRTVEAIYNYIPYNPGQGITGSGSAVYGYNVTDGTITNLTITQSGTSSPGIEFKNGSASCQTGGSIQGDVILGDGIYKSPSGCTINGDLWASATVQIGNNSVITGNVHASGSTSPVVQVANGAQINGNITSSGPVSISGSVGGSVIAGPTTGASSVSGSVGGTFKTAGTVSVSGSGLPASRVFQNQTGIVTPAPPVVPNWVDFNYNLADWTGFTQQIPTSCTGSTVAAAINAATTPTVVYASSVCPAGMVNLSGNNLTLNTDVVLIADAFDLKSQTLTSASGTGTHRLYIVSPDRVADAQPTCPAPAQTTKIENQVVTDSSLDIMIYTPCGLSNSGSAWWGQIYAANIAFNNSFTLHFISMGLPGVNFDNGTYTPPTPPVPGHLDTVYSVRNISG
ncbi:polymer-forming cytoskeletal protein [Leifsonia sp. AG29]|uniref:polymer-forming cytoskeletal protein n=1 Tax=Leifsonia sp. AG29 TaxID=2598860 RepID=UPI00131D114C|nr:polymer-forming cytoskeletal protein [Leifsonia sp. AG29]